MSGLESESSETNLLRADLLSSRFERLCHHFINDHPFQTLYVTFLFKNLSSHRKTRRTRLDVGFLFGFPNKRHRSCGNLTEEGEGFQFPTLLDPSPRGLGLLRSYLKELKTFLLSDLITTTEEYC